MDLAGLGALVAAVVAVPLALLPMISSIRSDRSKWRKLERLTEIGSKVQHGSLVDLELRSFQLRIVQQLRSEYEMDAEQRRILRNGYLFIASLITIVFILDLFLALDVPAWLTRVLATISGVAAGVAVSALITVLGTRRKVRRAQRLMKSDSSH